MQDTTEVLSTEQAQTINQARAALWKIRKALADLGTFQAGRAAESCEAAEGALFDALSNLWHRAGSETAHQAIDAYWKGCVACGGRLILGCGHDQRVTPGGHPVADSAFWSNYSTRTDGLAAEVVEWVETGGGSLGDCTLSDLKWLGQWLARAATFPVYKDDPLLSEMLRAVAEAHAAAKKAEASL